MLLGHLLSARRLVQGTANDAREAASGTLGNEDDLNKFGVVLVLPTIRVRIVASSVLAIIELNRRQANRGKLAHGVVAEDARGDEGCNVNATKAASKAKTGHARVKVPGTHDKEAVRAGEERESDAAEGVDDREARALLLSGVVPVQNIFLVLESLLIVGVKRVDSAKVVVNVGIIVVANELSDGIMTADMIIDHFGVGHPGDVDAATGTKEDGPEGSLNRHAALATGRFSSHNGLHGI